MASTSDVAQLLDTDAVADAEMLVVADGSDEVELGTGLLGAGLVGAGATRGRDVSQPVAESAADNTTTTIAATLRPADVIVTDLRRGVSALCAQLDYASRGGVE